MPKFGAVAPVVQNCSMQLVVHKIKAYWRYTRIPTRGADSTCCCGGPVRSCAVSKHGKQHKLVFEIYWHRGEKITWAITIVALINTQNTASAYRKTTAPHPPKRIAHGGCLMKMTERLVSTVDLYLGLRFRIGDQPSWPSRVPSSALLLQIHSTPPMSPSLTAALFEIQILLPVHAVYT